MTTRADIIDGKDAQLPDGSIRKFGLIYTQKCGWIDLGHANPEGRGFHGASSLWRQIQKTEIFRCVRDQSPVRVTYAQSMKRMGIERGVTRRYNVKRELPSRKEQESIALAIFMDVSIEFESLQANWFYRHVTNSGYSAEDLVSNLIGFYRALYPSINFIRWCEPVPKDQALAIWDTFGAVGSNKNYKAEPVLYPNPLVQCGVPRHGKLPRQLDSIKPAVQGLLFKEIR